MVDDGSPAHCLWSQFRHLHGDQLLRSLKVLQAHVEQATARGLLDAGAQTARLMWIYVGEKHYRYT